MKFKWLKVTLRGLFGIYMLFLPVVVLLAFIGNKTLQNVIGYGIWFYLLFIIVAFAIFRIYENDRDSKNKIVNICRTIFRFVFGKDLTED
jgi:predicted permease